MKKIIALVLSGMMFYGTVYAASLTANASPVLVDLSSSDYQNITFSYPTRNLDIYNMDSSAYVYVDLKSATNTSDRSSCALLGPGDSINLYDYVTSGISFIREQGIYGPVRVASPIQVIATY